MKPSHSIGKASEVLDRQGELAHARKRMAAARHATSTCLWSQTDSSDHLTNKAEGLLMGQYAAAGFCGLDEENLRCGLCLKSDYRQCGSYSVCRVEAHKFVVKRRFVEPSTSPITRFNRTRVVEIKKMWDQYYFACSCPTYAVFGIVCRHVLCLIDKARPEHCAPRWLKCTDAYYGRDGYEEITASITHLYASELPGPVCTRVFHDGDLAYLDRKFGTNYPSRILPAGPTSLSIPAAGFHLSQPQASTLTVPESGQVHQVISVHATGMDCEVLLSQAALASDNGYQPTMDNDDESTTHPAPHDLWRASQPVLQEIVAATNDSVKNQLYAFQLLQEVARKLKSIQVAESGVVAVSGTVSSNVESNAEKRKRTATRLKNAAEGKT
jgi:hypothetical protein